MWLFYQTHFCLTKSQLLDFVSLLQSRGVLGLFWINMPSWASQLTWGKRSRSSSPSRCETGTTGTPVRSGWVLIQWAPPACCPRPGRTATPPPRSTAALPPRPRTHTRTRRVASCTGCPPRRPGVPGGSPGPWRTRWSPPAPIGSPRSAAATRRGAGSRA